MTEKALEDRVGELNKSILNEADPDYRIKLFADMIVEGCKLNPKYNPSQDIDWFINTLPVPDVLIYVNEGTVNIFSNEPDKLGTVLLYDSENSGIVEEFNLPKTNGNASGWKASLETPNFDYGDFLEKFITNNT